MAPAWPPLDLDLKDFPAVECSIGYGSGVIRQEGYSGSRPMVDVVFVVRDESLQQWHSENLKAHSQHYSSLARGLGAGAVCCLQRWGPGLYYNPHVQIPTKSSSPVDAKYGVITEKALLDDLLHWRSLYLAGRLHKPFVLEWHSKHHDLHQSVAEAITQNRRAALCAALLRLSSHSWEQLLTAIVQLSYEGDVRVGVAEDPKKVLNIVNAQRQALASIYTPIASAVGVETGASGKLLFDDSPQGRQKLFKELPAEFQQRVQKAARGQPWMDEEALSASLRSTVRQASLQQSVKGLLSAGASRGLRYALEKVAKRLK